MLQWFLRFSEFVEFTEFIESSGLFRDNSIISHTNNQLNANIQLATEHAIFYLCILYLSHCVKSHLDLLFYQYINKYQIIFCDEHCFRLIGNIFTEKQITIEWLM